LSSYLPVRSEMMWSLYEIIHIWTAVVDESEEWSLQLILSNCNVSCSYLIELMFLKLDVYVYLVLLTPHYSNVAVNAQVCWLFCILYMPLFGLVQARPWFWSSMWISSVASISTVLCTSEVASATDTSVRMEDILRLGTNSRGVYPCHGSKMKNQYLFLEFNKAIWHRLNTVQSLWMCDKFPDENTSW